MNVYRIKISSWTAGFRYPNLISGYQPTLDVPPLSTVLGLINAAAGRYIEHQQLQIGYFFSYNEKAVDIETIYQVQLDNKGKAPSNSVRSNVINREFLHNCELYIYLQDKTLVEYLRKPVYQLLLGRSGDLATVVDIKNVELKPADNPEIKGQIIPYFGYQLAGVIQALPKYFTNTVPRNNIGTEPYSVISYYSAQKAPNIQAYTDNQFEDASVDVFFHELTF